MTSQLAKQGQMKVSEMKVPELKQELKRLGASSSGLKAVLVARLQQVLAENGNRMDTENENNSANTDPDMDFWLEVSDDHITPRSPARSAALSNRKSQKKHRDRPSAAPYAPPKPKAPKPQRSKTHLKNVPHAPQSSAEGFEIGRQLGKEGKEGTVYLVKDRQGGEYAMKQFKKGKSQSTLKHEIDMGSHAAAVGVAPPIVAYDLARGRIIMQKMARTLPELVQAQGGRLNDQQQLRLADLFQTLGDAGILHNDPNPLNIMEDQGGQLYLIDYGMAKPLKSKSKKAKAGANPQGPNPNMLAIRSLLLRATQGLQSTGILTERPALLLEAYEAYKASCGHRDPEDMQKARRAEFMSRYSKSNSGSSNGGGSSGGGGGGSSSSSSSSSNSRTSRTSGNRSSGSSSNSSRSNSTADSKSKSDIITISDDSEGDSDKGKDGEEPTQSQATEEDGYCVIC